MTSSDIIKSVGEILIADSTINSYIRNRCYTKYPLKPNSKSPLITLWIDDIGVLPGNLPAGNYRFEIGIWNSINNGSSLEVISTIKDRIRTLVNKNPDTINAQGNGTKVRLFDLVSAIMDEDFVGDLKMWYLPCMFDCIIGD